MLKSLRVRDYMSTHLPTLRADQDVFVAVERMLEHRTSGLAVLDEHGGLLGYLSDGDCLRAILTGIYHEEAGGQVGSCMTVEVETVSAQSSILDVAELFSHEHRRRLTVLEDGRFVGEISRHDVLRAMCQFSEHDRHQPDVVY